MPSTKKTPKYGNEKVGGFDSKKERDRYHVLKLLEKSGQIQDLQTQVYFYIIPTLRDDAGKLVARKTSYRADFVYTENGKQVVEDAKGFRTAVYKLKRALMFERFGILIKET